ncbi:MAG TPA: asparagine synthase (glutamine-hydrolyzing) [Rudaea sp.]|nr:asparagine synthase (glutamine-hydrolyzing) [Rudaea sp.]
MCGIAGILDLHADAPVRTHLEKMLAWMLKRGPDGSGQYADGALAMGMRRLSVIDLDGGWQPLYAADGQVVVFQNGEMYNYRELRAQLQRDGFAFRTHSDTEVLAHGYVAWGIDGLLQRVDGMFAFAILDRRSGELHLARDRFGEKPLFYAAADGRFAWASNLLALASLPWVNVDTDPRALDDYLAVHYVAGPRTFFRGVQRLLPGHRLSLRVADPVPAITRYYRPNLAESGRVSDDELADAMEAAVRSRLVADVPVGVFLSGGLDSSLITAIAARAQPGIMTFSMGFDSAAHDEAEHAQRVADYCGTRHHRFRFDADSFETLLPQVAAELDEPLGDQAALPLFWLCREARRHVTVALSGEGADELFAGYGYYRQFLGAGGVMQRMRDRLRGRQPTRAPDLRRFTRNPTPVTPSGFPLLTDPADRERLTGRADSVDDAWENELIRWLDSASDTHKRAMAADLGTWLPDDLLVKFDRMGMAHSLEGRAPYLTPRLAELALRGADPSSRMSLTDSKLALRRVARRWLPRDILERPKQGFVLPMRSWLRSWFERRGGVRAWLREGTLQGIDFDVVATLAEKDLCNGLQRERLLYAIVLLVEWHRLAVCGKAGVGASGPPAVARSVAL